MRNFSALSPFCPRIHEEFPRRPFFHSQNLVPSGIVFGRRQDFYFFYVIHAGKLFGHHRMLERSVFIFGSHWAEAYFFINICSRPLLLQYFYCIYHVKSNSVQTYFYWLKSGAQKALLQHPVRNSVAVCNTINVLSKRVKVKNLMSK